MKRSILHLLCLVTLVAVSALAPVASADASPVEVAPPVTTTAVPDCIGWQNPAPGLRCIGVGDDCVGVSMIHGCAGVDLSRIDTNVVVATAGCTGWENPMPGVNCIGKDGDCIGVSTVYGCRSVAKLDAQ